MDNLRLILSIGLIFVSMMLWNAWQKDYVIDQDMGNHSSSSDQTARTAEVPTPVKNSEVPLQPKNDTQKISKSNQIYKLENDVLLLEIDSLGGSLIRAGLKSYPDQQVDKKRFVELLSLDPENIFSVQFGLLGDEKLDLPTHKSFFELENIDSSTVKEVNTNKLVLVAKSTAGIITRRIYELNNTSYELKVTQEVVNESGLSVNIREYRQFLRGVPKNENKSAFIYTFTGGSWFSPEIKFKKLDFSELEKNNLEQKVLGGWLAMIQHYFVGALIPEKNITENFYSKHLGQERYLLGYYDQEVSLAPKDKHVFNGSVWLGPKLQNSLEALAPGLELTVDYGWLTVIAKPIFWLLTHIHQLLGNWGWSIVVLTILIKLAFYKLSATSYKSMAGMRKLAPKLQAIKERYGEDKEKFNKAMMELYQKEKINPLGGCLPIVVQIPVFIALYWVLLESVEMRDAPFILWISNLSMKDPYYILPLIMGITMFIQQKLNPAPPDPVQAKIMMSLPFIFTVFFAFFPAGLVLYWVVNNILSIAQQWYITQQIEKA